MSVILNNYFKATLPGPGHSGPFVKGFYLQSCYHMIIQYKPFDSFAFKSLCILSFFYLNTFFKIAMYLTCIHTHTLSGPHPLWIILPMTLLLPTVVPQNLPSHILQEIAKSSFKIPQGLHSSRASWPLDPLLRS